MIIEFHPYRLVPFDDRQWKMQRWYASQYGKSAGIPKWHDTGTYYPTLGQALRAAWEREMRAHNDLAPYCLEEAMRKAEEIRDMLAKVEVKEDR